MLLCVLRSEARRDAASPKDIDDVPAEDEVSLNRDQSTSLHRISAWSRPYICAGFRTSMLTLLRVTLPLHPLPLSAPLPLLPLDRLSPFSALLSRWWLLDRLIKVFFLVRTRPLRFRFWLEAKSLRSLICSSVMPSSSAMRTFPSEAAAESNTVVREVGTVAEVGE